jgi:hypothetical protein
MEALNKTERQESLAILQAEVDNQSDSCLASYTDGDNFKITGGAMSGSEWKHFGANLAHEMYMSYGLDYETDGYGSKFVLLRRVDGQSQENREYIEMIRGDREWDNFSKGEG